MFKKIFLFTPTAAAQQIFAFFQQFLKIDSASFDVGYRLPILLNQVPQGAKKRL
ncbi:hypothetical protein [Undibacterium terreum]|uniref:hypothetical protein n=1 Tax=Undibacterium terreum TaxID=1224302 RepID=UPI0016636103|nr:hypothetical protein [Undibacterium terreum]